MARDVSDDFAVAARALRVGAGREVSIWAVALVVRVEALVAIAFGFALDVIAFEKRTDCNWQIATCCISCDRDRLTCALTFISRAY